MLRRRAGWEDSARPRRWAALLSATLCAALAALWIAPGAGAQLVDTTSDVIPEECPEPSPTETVPPIDVEVEIDPSPSPHECDEEDGDDKDGDDKDGDDKKNDGGKKRDDRGGLPDPPDLPDDDGEKRRQRGRGDHRAEGDGAGRGRAHERSAKRKGTGRDAGESKTASTTETRRSRKFNATGEFDTEKLQVIATRLRAEGVDQDRILELVYTPFIIGGPAAWTNTWGAPRYGPGPIVRTHEGQDVFCRYGDPMLATESGTIEFDEGGLGGKVARLYRKDGSYWYYAHLSGFNSRDFKNGDAVGPGDVIGYCGNTGNAITTPPHVHFGWYQANGVAKDPMGYLVGWLRTAEKRATKAFEKITGESIQELPEETTARRFGDSFAPDISVLKVSSEALLAAASSPGSSAFGLAEAALQAALAQERAGERIGADLEVVPEGAGDDDSAEPGALIDESPSSSAQPQAD